MKPSHLKEHKGDYRKPGTSLKGIKVHGKLDSLLITNIQYVRVHFRLRVAPINLGSWQAVPSPSEDPAG